MKLQFQAHDYGQDTSLALARYEFEGEEERGWIVRKEGMKVLELGPGYRLLKTERCGVCSTDLDRHFLPFPLPQVTGHELLAQALEGPGRFVVEINASHAARGVAADCAFCRAGLETHCPERMVLGIDRLPGGFGPYVLAPVHAVIPVPDAVPNAVAVLAEPFAATLHAVRTASPLDGDRVAVLGPRRLGMLLVAALSAERARLSRRFEITALVRRAELGEVALQFGADRYEIVADDSRASDFDLVFDTTGNPEALPIALQRARREVHIKSTHGRRAAGLSQLTAMVVDELCIAKWPEPLGPDATQTLCESIGRFAGRPRPVLGWLSRRPPSDALAAHFEIVRAEHPLDLRPEFARLPGLPRADGVVVDAAATTVDEVIRPSAADEESILRPRGTIWLDPRSGPPAGGLLQAVIDKDLRVSTSRCGDFRAALELLAADATLRDRLQGLVTHEFGADALKEAFATARSAACIKAVVLHPQSPAGSLSS